MEPKGPCVSGEVSKFQTGYALSIFSFDVFVARLENEGNKLGQAYKAKTVNKNPPIETKKFVSSEAL